MVQKLGRTLLTAVPAVVLGMVSEVGESGKKKIVGGRNAMQSEMRSSIATHLSIRTDLKME